MEQKVLIALIFVTAIMGHLVIQQTVSVYVRLAGLEKIAQKNVHPDSSVSNVLRYDSKFKYKFHLSSLQKILKLSATIRRLVVFSEMYVQEWSSVR